MPIILIEPDYPKIRSQATVPCLLETMFCNHLLEHWYEVRDQEMQDWLNEVDAMWSFAWINLIIDAIPQEIMIFAFRYLLEKSDGVNQMVSLLKAHLKVNG